MTIAPKLLFEGPGGDPSRWFNKTNAMYITVTGALGKRIAIEWRSPLQRGLASADNDDERNRDVSVHRSRGTHRPFPILSGASGGRKLDQSQCR
jgi:hypothetical protein